eukprot:TRINITY_DN10462_c0_g1_i1.p1 TRINITY_DN10462_c0_g1~~TRINITY_DN10462_c0_g1_i1.p1  ORF type:complete len:572 (-),score=61.80 TRINITY_DN10462_c0_g1_i1:370-2085(-)
MSCEIQVEHKNVEGDVSDVNSWLSEEGGEADPRLSIVSSVNLERINIVSVNKHIEQKPKWYKQVCSGRFRSAALACVFATLGAFLTFRFQHGQLVNPVLASGITGALASCFGSPFREIMLSGSFSGMSGHVDTNGPFTYTDIVCVGIITGITFELFKPHFNGVGGKLGTIAFISSTSGALVKMANGYGWQPIEIEDPWTPWTWQLALVGIMSSCVGCAVTVGLMQKSPPLSSGTLASSTTALLANVIVAMPPDDLLSTFEVLVILCFAYTGSFAGMSTVGRVGSPWRIILAGAWSGAVLLALWPACPGIGGKFGFSAFVSVLSVERLPLNWLVVAIARSSVESGTNDSSTNGRGIEETQKESIQFQPEVADERRKRPSLSNILCSLQASRKDIVDDEDSMRDWLTWVPSRCWSCCARFLAAGGDTEAAVLALEETYGQDLHLDRSTCLALLSESHARQSMLEAVLNASLAAERCLAPPPPHPGVSDPTALFALTLFRAMSSTSQGPQQKSSEDSLPQNIVEPLLKSLGAAAVGLDQEVSAEAFAKRVETRVVARKLIASAQGHIDAKALVG